MTESLWWIYGFCPWAMPHPSTKFHQNELRSNWRKYNHLGGGHKMMTGGNSIFSRMPSSLCRRPKHLTVEASVTFMSSWSHFITLNLHSLHTTHVGQQHLSIFPCEMFLFFWSDFPHTHEYQGQITDFIFFLSNHTDTFCPKKRLCTLTPYFCNLISCNTRI